MKKIKQGFTLVELLITITIIAILFVIIASILNPTALMNKAIDAQSKKNLARIRIAFEEYYSDKQCFPAQDVVNTLMNKENCGKQVFAPWVDKWICERSGDVYLIAVEQTSCPQWYKIMVNLRNKKDIDIPAGWYDEPKNIMGGYTNSDVNYGVSSQNILWSD